MPILPIVDASIWDKFVSELNLNTFLHSWNWGQLNQQLGNQVWYFGLYRDSKLTSLSLVIKIKAKRGTFLLVPHGPQISPGQNQSDILKAWTEFYCNHAKDQNCSFVRVQPILADSNDSQEIFTKNGYSPAPLHVHTELSSVLDIQPTEKEIMMNMRKTTRQMVRKGDKLLAKNEVQLDFPSALSTEMLEVYQATSQRGGFVPYSTDYLNSEWETFSKNGNAKLISIIYEGKIISWGMIIISGKRAFYHQGANLLHKKIPASYMCHWQGILYAKQKNCVSYDFWGVSPIDKPNHPWANISLFKRGFGGQDVQLLHAQDRIVTWKYWLTWAVDKYRAYKRGFGG